MTLASYSIDANIFELYTVKSVRNHFNFTTRGLVRLVAPLASRNLITLTHVVNANPVPLHSIHKIGLEEYLIVASKQTQINIPGYVTSTLVHVDVLMSASVVVDGGVRPFLINIRPNIQNYGTGLLEGRFMAAQGGSRIEISSDVPCWFTVVVSLRHTMVVHHDSPAYTVSHDDVSIKWNIFLASPSPAMTEIRLLLMNNNVASQYFNGLYPEASNKPQLVTA